MAVESFYISADQRQALRWWNMPIGQALAELAQWRQVGPATNWALLSEQDDGVEIGLLAPLGDFQRRYGANRSLAEACQSVASIAPPPARSLGARLLSFGRSEPSAADERVGELASFANFYIVLHEAARAGPVTEPADLRDADFFLAAYLAQFMPADEAAGYNSSEAPNTIGLYLPPELAQLDATTQSAVDARLELGCLQLDPAVWQRRWQRLDALPNFWPQLSQQVRPEVLAHLRGLGEVASYATVNQLVLLKIGA